MKKRLVLAVTALAVAGLAAGCVASRPLSPEEKILRLETNECEAESDAMIGSRFYRELSWKWYFDHCMKQKGFAKDQNGMWH